jgi:hypothetical protein
MIARLHSCLLAQYRFCAEQVRPGAAKATWEQDPPSPVVACPDMPGVKPVRAPLVTQARTHTRTLPRLAVFKSACLSMLESDECRAAPKSRAERSSGAVRKCLQLPAHAPWVGHVEGTG